MQQMLLLTIDRQQTDSASYTLSVFINMIEKPHNLTVSLTAFLNLKWHRHDFGQILFFWVFFLSTILK